MKSKKRIIAVVLLALLTVALGVASFFVPHTPHHGSIKEVMKDAVLHEHEKVSLFGIAEVNPAVISAFTVTGILLFAALLIRIFVIPRFKLVPGKLQLLLEELVGLFEGLAKSNSPHCYKALTVYIFTAGVYIFASTIFELFGLQVISISGSSIALPAPLADINGAIAMGCQSYLFILCGGVAVNRLRGLGSTLKEFSLPISMSFRLFGALLSGLLVTELVYYPIYLSFALPVAVAVLFTLIHALVQTYVLTMLTAMFFGEVTEHHEKKPKKEKLSKAEKAAA